MNQLVQLGWTPEWESAFQSLQRPDLEPARVLEEQKKLYRVGTAAGERLAVMAGRLYHETVTADDRPAVGDWVALEVLEGRSRVRHILPRRTCIVRKAVFRSSEPQVVASNVDTVLVVTSLNRDFSPRRLERFLALVWESGARPVVVLNKSDLCDRVAAMTEEAVAIAVGVDVHALSAKEGNGVDALAAYLGRGETVAFVGSSGVGKSTLLNRLAGADVQAVKEIRRDDDRGRHTTTNRNLIVLPNGALLLDTPGMREIALWADGEGMEAAFSDIEALARQCRFRDCAHGREPGCAVVGAVRRGRLDADRYESYGKLKRELAHIETKQNQRAANDAKRRWKRRPK